MKTNGWLVALVVGGALWGCEKQEATSDEDGSGGQLSTDGGSGGTASGGELSGSGGKDGSGGANTDPMEKVPVLGERGSSCDSSSNCEEGLSCIVTSDCPAGIACANKTCQPSNFEIMGTGKQCYSIDCVDRTDCCGDMKLDAPEKCNVRDSKCFQPTFTDCVATVCEDDDVCGSGRCAGTCQYDSDPSGVVECQTVDDCEEDVCVFDGGSGGSGGTGGTGGTGGGGGTGGTSTTGTCSVTGVACLSDANCYTNQCSTPYCRCDNPDYDPTDPVCEDEDCEGICGFTCEDERCIVDTSCKVDSDCSAASPFCDDGTCVECLSDDDCEEESCLDGRCGPECEVDTQCGAFEICADNACEYVGCQTDRECILRAENQGVGQDPRLSTCKIEDGIGACVFPCEIDAQCGITEICVDSVCEYIGCETDAECKTIAGLHNQPPPSDERPWTTVAECRAENE